MGRLDSKVALITGAASGLGRVAADVFAGEGARVMVADVTDDQGAAAVDAIKGAGGEAAFVRFDVSDDAGTLETPTCTSIS
jgi:NAD(P)-dependent dehydrogenase (short-subunit alcohol dehydrogenase family)